MKIKGAVFSVCLMLAAALSAGPALAEALDPCALLTRDEAQAVLGEPVGEARTAPVTGMAAGRQCGYYTSAPLAQRGGVGSVSLVVYDPETMASGQGFFKDPEAYFERMRDVLAKRGKTEPVEGLPGEAFWAAGAGTLHMLLRGYYVQVKVRDLTKLSAPTRTELDAKIAAHRLKQSQEIAARYVAPRIPGQ